MFDHSADHYKSSIGMIYTTTTTAGDVKVNYIYINGQDQ